MADARTGRGWPRLLLGYSLAIAAVWFTSRTIGSGLEQLRQTPRLAGNGAIIASLFLMLAHTLCNREAFVQLCRSMDSGVAAPTLRRVWAHSLLAKYIPGGIWQLMGRALQLRQLNARNRSAWYSGVVEQAISLGLCTGIALVAGLLLAGYLAWAVVALVCCLSTTLLIWRWLPDIASPRHLLRAMALYSLAMPFYLAAYACIASTIPLLDLTTRLFTGTTAGMLAFVVPGGLGVRESVASLLGNGQAATLLAAMVLVRLLTISIEACLWLSVRARQAVS